MSTKSNPYRSYLMRLWTDSNGRQYTMLERITYPYDRFYFSSLDDMFLFLIIDRDGERDPPGADTVTKT
ncbi:MAG: hypothetical protein CL608_20770 [Anaerolineaceae bacterium]|nr:hypothetical protein [Anaerolineaceae bacterium]